MQRSSIRTLVLLLPLLCGIDLVAGEAPLARLRRLHDNLRKRIGNREQVILEAGRADDFTLTLDGAVGGSTVTLALPRRGGGWTRPRLTGLPDEVVLHELRTDALELVGDELTGHIAVVWSRRAFEPIGGERWEDSPGEREAFARREQEITITARWHRQRRRYELNLSDAIPGISPIHLVIERSAAGELSGFGQARQWNRAIHDVDVAALEIEDDRLRGPVPMILRPDKWIPKDQQPREQTYTLNAAIADGVVSGTYTGAGQMGEAADAVTGTARQVLDGWFSTATAAGPLRGLVDGHVAPGRPVLDAEAPPQTADAAALYVEIQALALVDRSYPQLALSAARNRVRYLAATVPDARTTDHHALLAAYAAALAPFPNRGNTRPDDPRFGPYATIASLPVEDVPGGILPEQAPTDTVWFRVDEWRCADFSVPRAEAETAVEPPVLPELALMPGCAYPTAPGAAETAALTAGPFHRPARRLDDDNAKQVHPDPAVRYGMTLVEAQADTEAWLAIKADDGGCLWLDHAPIWCSEPTTGAYDRHRWAIVPVHLRKGANRFVARSISTWEGGGFELRIHLGPGPRSDPRDPPAAAPLPHDWRGFRGDGTATFPDADPPLAWDWQAGTNLAWRRELPLGHASPVVWRDRVLVTAEPTTLACFAAADGAELWRAEESTLAVAGEDQLASSTPVVHGERVYAFFGNGELRCHDLDGALQWAVDTGLRARGPNAPSPIMVDGRLLLQAYVGEKDAARAEAIGVDPADGAVLWRTRLPTDPRMVRFVDGKWDSSWRDDGAPTTVNGLAGLRLTAGDDIRDLAISSAGHVLDAGDGRLLHTRPVAPLTRAAPQVHDDTAYFSSVQGESALRLWLDADGSVGCRLLWLNRRRLYSTGASTSVGSRRTWYRGPLVHDGLLYVQRTKWNHWPQHHPKPWTEVSTYAPDDGLFVGQVCPVMRKAANAAGQAVRAGDYLFFVDAGGEPAPSSGHADDASRLCPALPGRLPQSMATIETGKLLSCPIFAGDRLYLRTAQALACIAVDGAAGAAFQEELLAEELLVRIPPKPRPEPILAPAPDETNYFEVDGAPVWQLTDRAAPDDWLFCGPLPLNGDADPLAPLGGQAEARPTAGTTLGDAADAPAFIPIPRDFIQIRYNTIVYWSRKPATSCALDLKKAVGGKQNTRSYYYTVVFVPTQRTVAVAVANRGATVSLWLAGEKIEANKPVRLRPGFYPLLLRADLGRLPPFIKQVVIEPQFREKEDAAQQLAAWREEVRRLRPRLERVLRKLPDTKQAKRAGLVLKGLE